MKIFLYSFFLFSLSAGASTLEDFFSSLEGQWKSTSAEAYRETTDGQIFHSRGTKFEATVTRLGNRWDFSEDSCWEEESTKGPVCGISTMAYVVSGEDLSIILEGETIPVDVLEMDQDYLILKLSTPEYVFTAVISRDGSKLSQEAVMQLTDGTKIYQLLALSKQ